MEEQKQQEENPEQIPEQNQELESKQKQEQEEQKYIPKTDVELKQIAMDLFDGKIFSSAHLTAQNEEDMIGMVFMPIGLGGLAGKTEEELDDIGLIYEYLDEAGPRSVNGMPNFFSCKVLNKEDTKKAFEFYEQYKTVKEAFMKAE